jgi:hypothetical protein
MTPSNMEFIRERSPEVYLDYRADLPLIFVMGTADSISTGVCRVILPVDADRVRKGPAFPISHHQRACFLLGHPNRPPDLGRQWHCGWIFRTVCYACTCPCYHQRVARRRAPRFVKMLRNKVYIFAISHLTLTYSETSRAPHPKLSGIPSDPKKAIPHSKWPRCRVNSVPVYPTPLSTCGCVSHVGNTYKHIFC